MLIAITTKVGGEMGYHHEGHKCFLSEYAEIYCANIYGRHSYSPDIILDMEGRTVAKIEDLPILITIENVNIEMKIFHSIEGAKAFLELHGVNTKFSLRMPKFKVKSKLFNDKNGQPEIFKISIDVLEMKEAVAIK